MDRRLLWAVLILCLVGGCKEEQAKPLPKPGEVAVYFSPGGGCTDAVVLALNQAKKTVLVQAYSFTSAPIAKALVDVHSGARPSRSSWTRAT